MQHNDTPILSRNDTFTGPGCIIGVYNVRHGMRDFH